MGYFDATEERVTQTKETKIGLCEQVRGNYYGARAFRGSLTV